MMSLETALWPRRCFPFSGILFRSGIRPPDDITEEGELVMPGLSAMSSLCCLPRGLCLHAQPAQRAESERTEERQMNDRTIF